MRFVAAPFPQKANAFRGLQRDETGVLFNLMRMLKGLEPEKNSGKLLTFPMKRDTL